MDVVLLHGFAGTRRFWDPVVERLGERYRPVVPDLPGHGSAPAAASFDAAVDHLLSVTPERFALCGYSLGGRLALGVALRAPERVAALGLVSATAGNLDPGRSGADEARARLIAENYEAFVAGWRDHELFADDPLAVKELIEADQRRNDPARLAAALRALGPAVSPPMWDRLRELDIPVAVLAGARDEVYVAVAKRVAAAIPRARLEIVPGAGHRVPLEAPQAVAAALDEILRAP